MPESRSLPFRREVPYNADGDYYDDLVGQADSYYEKEYLALNPTMHEEDVPSKVEAFRRAVAGPLAGVAVERLLDLGCGSCRVLQEVLARPEGGAGSARQAFGVDISGGILGSGARDARITRLRADCRDLPLANGSIDVAMCFDILEHVAESEAVAAEVARIAEYAVFKVPLELAVYTWMRGGPHRLAELRTKFGHVRHFGKRSLLRLLRPHWKVVAVWYMKIPRRGWLADRIQTALLAIGLHGLFASLFGGFAVVVAQSLDRISDKQ